MLADEARTARDKDAFDHGRKGSGVRIQGLGNDTEGFDMLLFAPGSALGDSSQE